MSIENYPDQRSIFDLSEAEAKQRLQPRLEELKKELFAKGLPITYQDERCPTEDHYIREYEDGRVNLSIFDDEKSEFTVIKDLSNA